MRDASCVRRVTPSVVLLWLAAAFPAGCSDSGDPTVTVMTRNLYLGFSEAAILTAGDPEALVVAVTEAWQAVQDTDFPERASALADEIDETRPDLIGLQEAALYRIQSPGDLLVGGSVPATEVAVDFVATLLDELAGRGAPYVVVASVDLMDVELPTLTGDDLRLTDRDVILARADVIADRLRILSSDAGRFGTVLELPVASGATITVVRGWVAADVMLGGREFRFVSTHLESASAPIQEAQALELLAGPADTTLPVILVGDLNSDAFGAGTESYEIVLDGGFEDAWTSANPGAPGLTWGHSPDLLNEVSTMTERLDLILFRGPFRVEAAVTTGDDPADRTASGLWPSDHAGVVGTLVPRR